MRSRRISLPEARLNRKLSSNECKITQKSEAYNWELITQSISCRVSIISCNFSYNCRNAISREYGSAFDIRSMNETRLNGMHRVCSVRTSPKRHHLNTFRVRFHVGESQNKNSVKFMRKCIRHQRNNMETVREVYSLRILCNVIITNEWSGDGEWEMDYLGKTRITS